MPSPLLPGTSIAIPKGSSGRGISSTTIEIQGLGAVIEHFFTIARLTEELAPQVVDFYADVVVHNARQFVRKKTWATHDSISKGEGVFVSGFNNKSFDAEIFASTPQARFLEWGTVNMPAYPFMIPAIDMVEKDFIRAFVDIAKIADQLSTRVSLQGDVGRDARVRNPISRLRSGLYSASKFLGDIAVFGGVGGLSPLRSNLLSMARLLGDVNASMTGAIGMRVSHRLRGRAVGRLAGFGSASLTASRSYTGSFTGGQRVYNRFVGRLSSPVITLGG